MSTPTLTASHQPIDTVAHCHVCLERVVQYTRSITFVECEVCRAMRLTGEGAYDTATYVYEITGLDRDLSQPGRAPKSLGRALIRRYAYRSSYSEPLLGALSRNWSFGPKHFTVYEVYERRGAESAVRRNYYAVVPSHRKQPWVVKLGGDEHAWALCEYFRGLLTDRELLAGIFED